MERAHLALLVPVSVVGACPVAMDDTRLPPVMAPFGFFV